MNPTRHHASVSAQIAESSNVSRILITGGTGQVGGSLLSLLQPFGEIIAPAREELDLADRDAIRAFIRAVAPRWIINPAAYTAVDRAESEPDLANAINALAPEALGIEAVRLGIPVIHFSTDYVFDGHGTRPWVETDRTRPLNTYGRTKLAGEQALSGTGAVHIILRTSWVYAARGKNFPLTILRLARDREEMNVVADQHGAPTSADSLARLVVQIIAQTENAAACESLQPADVLRPKQGLYHAADSGETTWYEFAQEIIHQASKLAPNQRFARLVPITTAEYPTHAQRPMNSRLNCGRLGRRFGFIMPRWQESIAELLQTVSQPPEPPVHLQIRP